MADINREKILAAAKELLVQRGIEGITMEDAASLAQLSRKTVYNHFHSRALLVDEVITAFGRETLELLESIAGDEERSFPDKLNDIIASGFSNMRIWGRMFNRPALYLNPRSAFPGDLNLREELRGFIERIVIEACESGLISVRFAPRRLAWVFINIVEGLMALNEMQDESFGKAELLHDTLKAMIGGILSDEGRVAMNECILFKDDSL